MVEQLLSQKYANYNYAPGIATYGIDGKTGQSGNDGNNIYFTDYNINENDGLSDLMQKILNNYLPIKGVDTKINRAYKENDIFFDRNGIIYKLININVSLSLTEWKDYFTIVGKIHINDDEQYFGIVNNRLVLNTKYNGYDICSNVNANDASQYINTEAAVNIVSRNIDENDNIEMVRMQSIDDVDVEDGKMSVLYKTTENAFYIDSNKPIVIDGDLKVENDNNTNNEYDNFSTVLTSNDPITYFKYLCDNLNYSIIYDDLTDQYKVVIYQTDGNIDKLEYLIKRNETVFGKIYTAENEQVLLKLSDIITTPLYIEDYVDRMSLYNFTIDDNKFNFSIGNNNINANDISIETESNNSQKSANVKVAINNSNININNFKVGVIQNNESENIICANRTYPLESERCRFTFKSDDFNVMDDKQLTIVIYPNEKYKCENNNTLTEYPIKINIHLDNIFSSGEYSMYFKLIYDNDTNTINLNDIMVFDKNNLLESNRIIYNCIQTYVPNSINSVYSFSLVYNTEVFLKYENNDNDVYYDTNLIIDNEIDKLYLQKFNHYICETTQDHQLVIDDGDYYCYSGQTEIFDGQLCYVWDRYENGEKCDINNDNLDYECKFLTSSLNLTLPFNSNRPECIAVLTGYDNDTNYNFLLEDHANDGSQWPSNIPDNCKGLCILSKKLKH